MARTSVERIEGDVRMEAKEIKVNTTIQFNYSGNRLVIADVTRVDNKIIIAKLKTDYFGKNEDWYVGEEKHFVKSIMKNILTHNNNEI